MSQSSSGQAPARQETNLEYLDPTRSGIGAEELQRNLLARVIGQDEAVKQVVDVYDRYLAGLTSRGRPVANLLFLGPTGTGKTRLVEATAESLLGSDKAVIKIDCAEFQQSHEIAKLIGSPPGYLGHRETRPALCQETLDQFHTATTKISVVLFDEVEKASDALWNLLLGILDKATLTLGDNRKVDFSRAIVFMTSNLGAAEMESTLRPNLGFAAAEMERDGAAGAAVDDKIARIGVSAARRKFTPEFINRLDKILVFRSLNDAELRKILDLEVRMVQQRTLESGTTPFVFFLTEAAKDVLIAEGTDVKYGARPLKRSVERSLINPLSKLITSGQVRSGDLLRVDYDASQRRFTFAREAEKLAGNHIEFFAKECVGCTAGIRWTGNCWAGGNAIQCPNHPS